MKFCKKLLWILFGLAASVVGLYPLTYTFLYSKTTGVLASKPRELVASTAYMVAFYIHIALGGIALLAGWSQFIRSWRSKHLRFHKFLGYVYVISVLGSSVSGLIIAIFSSGKAVAAVGFGLLAVCWLISLLAAFFHIKRKSIKEHQKWMLRNYALTFSAITLRIYLPIALVSSKDIVLALQIASWLCWVPNVIVIEIYIRRRFYGIDLEPLEVSSKLPS